MQVVVVLSEKAVCVLWTACVATKIIHLSHKCALDFTAHTLPTSSNTEMQ